jgi:hypothetical protein
MLRLLAVVFTATFSVSTVELPSAENGKFVGGLMGVSAKVNLCLGKKVAAIELSGLPLGGTLAGTARFQDGEGSPVVVDEPLRSALRRRFVKIVGAEFDREKDIVLVTVKLPLLLGTQTIRLLRASDNEKDRAGVVCHTKLL